MRTLELDLCKRLKDLGYDGLGIYSMNVGREQHLIVRTRFKDEDSMGIILAPTAEMVAEWLREKHNIYVFVEAVNVYEDETLPPTVEYAGIIKKLCSDKTLCRQYNVICKSYDGAFEGAVAYALDMLKKS